MRHIKKEQMKDNSFQTGEYCQVKDINKRNKS